MASAAESRELEANAALYPEVRAALDEAARLMEDYAKAHAVAPPPGIRQKVWQSLEEETASAKPSPSVTAHQAPVHIAPPASGSGVPVSTIGFWKYATAAAVTLLVASAAVNMYLVSGKRDADQKIAALEREQHKMDFERTVALQQEEVFRNRLRSMVSPDMKSFALNGVGAHAEHKAMLYWNSTSGEVFLSMRGMPPLPEDKQYQLWAIVDGKPVDAGMYRRENNVDLWAMKVTPRADMFAVTIEDAGGSPTPTMDQMVVAGKPG
jgi:anti-sigma-K factor RskA